MAVALAVFLVLQFRSRSYRPPLYWITVVLISIVGTCVTDNLTDGLGVPSRSAPPCSASHCSSCSRSGTGSRDPLDPQHRHAPPGSVLLARDPVHLRPRHRRRRSHRGTDRPGVLPVTAPLRRCHRGDRRRLVHRPTRPGALLLDRVHPQPPPRRIHRRPAVRVNEGRRPGVGTITTSIVFFVIIAAIISYLVIRIRRDEPAQRSRLTV